MVVATYARIGYHNTLVAIANKHARLVCSARFLAWPRADISLPNTAGYGFAVCTFVTAALAFPGKSMQPG